VPYDNKPVIAFHFRNRGDNHFFYMYVIADDIDFLGFNGIYAKTVSLAGFEIGNTAFESIDNITLDIE